MNVSLSDIVHECEFKWCTPGVSSRSVLKCVPGTKKSKQWIDVCNKNTITRNCTQLQETVHSTLLLGCFYLFYML